MSIGTAVTYQSWRTLVRGLLILFAFVLPFVRITGESAFRFDVPSLTLHVFGSRIAMDEFFFVLIFILALGFLIILVTILFGRIWCGWICPQTVIVDATRFVDRGSKHGIIGKISAAFAVFAVSTLLAADILWYFVSPYDFITRLLTGKLGPVVGWSWGILTIVTFLNFLFLRRIFCSTICPYAKLQGALYDEQTLIIAMDPERQDECMGCDACVKTCPVNIDVRRGVQAACINCAECIDACSGRMAPRSRTSLIGYRFGLNNNVLNLRRKGVAFAATGTLVFLLLLAYLSASRTSVELIVLPDMQSAPKITPDGELVNIYILTVTNRSDRDTTFAISATGAHGTLLTIPERIDVRKNGHERIRIAVKTRHGFAQGVGPATIIISVISEPDKEFIVQHKVMMSSPW